MSENVREELRRLFENGYFLEARRAALKTVGVDSPPIWMTMELQESLDEIEGPHERKKRTTVLRLAEAAANDTPARQVFASKDCCSGPIWYGRTTGDKTHGEVPGWKDDPQIAASFELAKRLAHWHQDELEKDRQAMRRQILSKTETRLAEISGAAVEVLLDVMLSDESAPDTRRKAAVDALTHAAPETAPKSQAEANLDISLDTSGPSMRDIRNRPRRLEGRVVAPEDEEIEELVVEGVVGDEAAPPPVGGFPLPMIQNEPPPETGSNGDGE